MATAFGKSLGAVVVALTLTVACVALKDPAPTAETPIDGGSGTDALDGPPAAGDAADASREDAGAVDRAWARWYPTSGQEFSIVGSDRSVAISKTTGLSWQRVAQPLLFSFAQAQGVCASLNLAGLDGWVLPTRIELLSLGAYLQPKTPLIDDGAFPDSNDTFWTATPSAEDATEAWAVDFDFADAKILPRTEFHRVRCVRLPGVPSAPHQLVAGAETAFDPATNLTWKRAVASPRTLAHAGQLCRTTSPIGTFRLPYIDELYTIVDERKSAPGIAEVFPVPATALLWSGSHYANNPDTLRWTVSAQSGTTIHRSATDVASVLCVK